MLDVGENERFELVSPFSVVLVLFCTNPSPRAVVEVSNKTWSRTGVSQCICSRVKEWSWKSEHTWNIFRNMTWGSCCRATIGDSISNRFPMLWGHAAERLNTVFIAQRSPPSVWLIHITHTSACLSSSTLAISHLFVKLYPSRCLSYTHTNTWAGGVQCCGSGLSAG